MTPVVNARQTHTHAHTHANNKGLHRRWVTLETLANKHTCSHAGGPSHTYAGVSFSYKPRVALSLALALSRARKAREKQTKAQTKHVRWDVLQIGNLLIFQEEEKEGEGGGG